VDRIPLGDVAATVSSVVCTNPDLDVWVRFGVDGREWNVRVSDIAHEFPIGTRCGLAVARRVSERIKAAVAELQVTP
jgi:hypothetical protein